MDKFKNVNKSELDGLVHDLKTPITSIMGFVELLKRGGHDEKTTTEFYDIILSESQKLLKLVNDILYINKTGENKIDPCNLTIQLDKYVKELTPLAHKHNVKICINSASSDIYVSIPEDKISRILINIIENAIKYNKEYGKIFIDIEEENKQVSVKIRDTGVGIPENELDKIFNRYYRSSVTKKMSVEGSGLGLAIANDIVKDYNGQIKVNSKLGEYTEFIITFPASHISK